MAGFTLLICTLILSLAKFTKGDNAPYFVDPPFSIKVNEDTKTGVAVENITVKDSDPGDKLTITLDSIGKELFSLGNPTGQSPLTTTVLLKEPLDREVKQKYSIHFTVKDNSANQRSTTKEVAIFVMDYNDNAPIFQDTPYSAKIKENTPSGVIYQVSATDQDIGSSKTIQYSFVDECKLGDCQLFIIDSTKGEVSLNSSFTLDYETKNRYNLLIMAKDGGVPSLNSSTTLVIEVTDESDQPPEFEKSSYRADIEENIALGTSVARTRAFDGDRGINNPVTYAIVGGDDDHYFKIDQTTGVVTVNKSIDRDTGNDFFELIVQAKETNENTTGNTTVFIKILDINDNRPTFPSSGFPYSTVIPEDTQIGTPIFFQMGAFDNDREAANSRFEYSIYGDPQHYFKMTDSTIGRIELNRTLDFETQQQFVFLVIAQETSSVEKYSANQTITVNVSNVNDNEPKFNESQFNFTVSESTTPGTILGHITAVDGDSGVFGEITYSLAGFGSEKFSIAKNNGTLSLAASLDFEGISSYDLILEAKDGGNRITRVKVMISITDYNDNTPSFDLSPPTATLKENQDSGFSVEVKATDKDSGNNSLITYSIVGGDPLHNFTIDSETGVITNVGPLDYETQTNFTLVIMAKDRGIPSLNSTRKLPITIIDQNDNKPYFNQTSFNVDLMENTDIDVPVVRLFAFDVDSGKNAELIYSIVSGNEGKKFTIDADGVLLTRSSPDREKMSVYTLNISVSDVGTPKKYAYAEVVVNILDENDDSPKFNITVDKKYIKEGPSTLNTVVAKNVATDNDAGLAGTVRYEIGDGNSEGKFAINNETGEVTVARELDFEEVRIYSLKIEASDMGVLPRTGEYQLVVEVLDINDNSPVFDQTEYSFTVLENRPNGTIIVTLRADDKDYGRNKLITYSIVHGNTGSAFSINNETGQISTNIVLDRENKSQYLLTVKAKDHGDPPRESTTNVTIVVRDVNDQTPLFSKSSYNITIPENTPRGTSVFTLSASDADDGPAGQVSYLMHDVGNLENGNSVFSIGSKSGEVKTAIQLDFEIHRSFTLTITASDSGSPSLSSNVTLSIAIGDVDDNPPVFTNDTWSAVVNENAKSGTIVTQVSATDKDFETIHKTIYYKIDGGNNDGIFGIRPENGTVYVKDPKNLDRETEESYELVIKAQTLNAYKNVTVQESSTKLTISVEDYNDYAPKFQQGSYSKKVPESFELHEVVVTVIANDEDIGVNQEISYSISSGNDEGIFAIDNTTGVVTIVKKLDRETTDHHTLIVTARDHGIPSLESNVTITVTVTDTNDNIPTLIIQKNSFTVMENATNGTAVTQFNATDNDLNKNAEVGYRIVSGNDDEMFIVDDMTGVLRTNKLLDYEKVQRYQIGIQAYDRGTPSLRSDIKHITIHVEDVNDNPPNFGSQKTITLSVFENEGSGAVVGTVKANDKDATDALYYYIRKGGNGTDYFSIDESTGVVTATSMLDREAHDTYDIYVQVFNSKKTKAYIDALGALRRKRRSVNSDNIQRVIIKINDRNDNPPTFKHSSYQAGVSESAEINTRITQITCLDKDIGNNSRLTYKLVDLKPANLLSVEPETGWLLAGEHKYYAGGVGKTYTFTYSCSDSLANATTNVTIFVLVDKQRIRLTLKLNDTEYVRNNIDEIKEALNYATGLEFNDDSIQYHLQGDKYDLQKVDIFMHAVDPKTNKVVDKDTALALIDKNWGKLREMFRKFKVDAVEPKQPDDSEDTDDINLIVAIALGIVLFMILLCFFCVICLMRRSHNRKLRAAKASGTQDSSYGLTTPGTNLMGTNPVWMDPYDNWKMEDDKNSNAAKLYEDQELSMDMFRDDESPESTVLPGTFYESSANGAAYHPNGILQLHGLDNYGVEDEVTNI